MTPKRSTLSNNGEKDQETLNNPILLSDDDDHLPLSKRRIKIQISPKRPISTSCDPIPPSKLVFDSETDSDDDGNQDSTLPPEIHDELTARIPMEYRSLMNFMGWLPDSSPRLVADKRLTKRDVDGRRNRFLVPARKIRFGFMSAEEEAALNRKKWCRVEIIEPDCTVSLVTMSKWATKKGPAYVFITEWMGLVERNELKEGDFLQLWSFRAGGSGGSGGRRRLCFMLLEFGDD